MFASFDVQLSMQVAPLAQAGHIAIWKQATFKHVICTAQKKTGFEPNIDIKHKSLQCESSLTTSTETGSNSARRGGSRGCGSGAQVAKLDWLPDSLKKRRQEKAPPGDQDILYYITQYIRLYRLWP